MKKLIKQMVFGIGCFLFVFGLVRAETFYEGDYISGEYINKVISGKTYYMTMQYIKDTKGNIVYCLEPFITFEDGKVYQEYTGDLVGYNSLTTEQKRRISLIIYYGYGYGDRKDSKWYVVTQYLVWKVVDSNANIYFTNTLNGTKIDKYLNEQKEILNDVDRHDIVPSFVKNYEVTYKENFIIDEFKNDYEIISSSYEYSYKGNSLVLSDLENDGEIVFKKISNYYDGNVTIYDSSNSQDVIRPGNVVNNILIVPVKVLKGDITLDIRDDDSVYTIESDFSNTCYEISKNDEIVGNVCTADEALVYKSDYLEYGKYEVKQTSVGIGYLPDTKIYQVIVDEKNPNPSIILYNKLLKNDIELVKYACNSDYCEYEEGAVFEIFDKENNLVDSLITNTNGYSSITLGYGEYLIKQVKGLEGYTMSDEYKERIIDEEARHFNELYNYYIVLDNEVLGEVIEIPDTKVDGEFIIIRICEVVGLILKQYLQFFNNLL